MTYVSNSPDGVSIVVPCFNREAHIGDAIESCLIQRQDNARIEIIVVDDGSTDQSSNVIESFGNRITSIKIPNGGVAAARNIGVKNSSHQWIKFLDSDDMLLQGAISLQQRQARTLKPMQIPVGQLTLSQKTASPLGLTNNSGRIVTNSAISSKSLQVSQPLLPRSAFNQVGGFRNSSISEDYELIFRLALADWKLVEFPEPVAFFLDHNDPKRLSKNVDESRFREVAEVFERLIEATESAITTTTNELRLGLGQNAWSMGRRAARLGHSSIARRLFNIAEAAGGKNCRNAKLPVRLLYKLADPVYIEVLLQTLKLAVTREPTPRHH
jgi:glycosyltransferase involved in cell wall biosynthesis